MAKCLRSLTLSLFLALGSWFCASAQAPVADFSWSFPGLPNKVQFQDQSLNFPTSWYWSFGDGTASALHNPLKIYTVAGTYYVCLIVRNAAGTDTTCGNLIVGGVTNLHTTGLASTTKCAGSLVTLDAKAIGGVPPYTYNWNSVGDAISCTNCAHPQIVVSQQSTYYVTVIDALNVSFTASAVYSLSGYTTSMQASATNAVIDCLHPIDTAVVTIVNGIPPYSIYWGDGSISFLQKHYYAQGGEYVIRVVDSVGCDYSFLNSVIYQGITIYPVDQTHPLCEHTNTGKIVVAATGGTPPYSFAWSNGTTADSVVNVEAGVYWVTVTNAASCSNTFMYNLSPLTGWGYYSYLTSSASNCSNNGYINLQVYGGSSPFNFLWSNGNTTQNLTNLASGVYTVSVTDSLGCLTTGIANITNACYSVISGTLFADTNSNCVFDAVEQGYANALVTVQDTANGQYYYATPDTNGNYYVLVPEGEMYDIRLSQSFGNCMSYTLCDSSAMVVMPSGGGDTLSNYNFSVTGTQTFDLEIHPGWRSANPGFAKDYWIYVRNYSSTPFQGQATVTFDYDSNLIYQSSTLGGVHNFNTHTITWTLSAAQISSGGWNNPVKCFFLVPANFSTSQLLYGYFHVEPTAGDCDVTNNSLNISEPVTGSLDPNMKEVSPEGQITEEDSVLTYTIHFQNTGNDSTHFIILKDTLSPHLDPSTVRNIASSHPYSEFTISGSGILTWTFNPLRLVDSFTNEPGSHGFVMFTIKKKKNLPIGTIISNKASIYFDYNAPVVTNTVANTIADPNFIFELRSNATVSVKAFPNPFSSNTTILVEGIQSKFDFELYDVTGRLRRKISSIENNQFSISKNELSSGVYFFKIVTGGNNRSGHGKLVVE